MRNNKSRVSGLIYVDIKVYSTLIFTMRRKQLTGLHGHLACFWDCMEAVFWDACSCVHRAWSCPHGRVGVTWSVDILLGFEPAFHWYIFSL